MHIYFSGIGGVGLGPLAEIALDAGYQVSGSDAADSPMFRQLSSRGAEVHLGQEVAIINQLHANQPIDWFVYTSALPDSHPELEFARSNGIKISKRDELLAHIIKEKNLKLIAVSGTHGKTTTTAMIVWLFHQLGLPVSYSIGSSISFGPSGAFDAASEYFVYECDEFDRNFLNFHPFISLIPSQSYDHTDTYPTQADYDQAFEQFRTQSETTITWKEITSDGITLAGEHNRSNGALAIAAVEKITNESREKLAELLQTFPGTGRRFEKLANNLYSDYAHHPEEIAASLQLARELSEHIVVVYQPHQNIRQHQIEYGNCFDEAEKIYWLPTYLSREDPNLNILSPEQLTKDLPQEKVIISNLDDSLHQSIEQELANGKLVVMMGAGSIDTWAREQFTS
jgi:UDP-N-acetylmuramate--alanine ligase